MDPSLAELKTPIEGGTTQVPNMAQAAIRGGRSTNRESCRYIMIDG